LLPTSSLDYTLPNDLIATTQAEPRDSARMLVCSRREGVPLQDKTVRDLPSFLKAGDVLVLNVSRVIPARFFGHRADTQGKVEGLYLGPPERPLTGGGDITDPVLWRAMLKGRRVRPGITIKLEQRNGSPADAELEVIERLDDLSEGGACILRLRGFPPGTTALDALAQIGHAPLPPYIVSSRKRAGGAAEVPADAAGYQTVYADPARVGSVAAPTAGLHFTPALLDSLDKLGVRIARVALHVGAGTFKPVETEFVQQHPMHQEWCAIPPDAARTIEHARRESARIFAVGTTSARTLESFTRAEIAQIAESKTEAGKWTKLLITPGHTWQNIDGLMTNFHLPRTTLMAMVASLMEGGVPQLKTAYEHAIAQRYRFYSFGDSMLVLP